MQGASSYCWITEIAGSQHWKKIHEPNQLGAVWDPCEFRVEKTADLQRLHAAKGAAQSCHRSRGLCELLDTSAGCRAQLCTAYKPPRSARFKSAQSILEEWYPRDEEEASFGSHHTNKKWNHIDLNKVQSEAQVKVLSLPFLQCSPQGSGDPGKVWTYSTHISR